MYGHNPPGKKPVKKPGNGYGHNPPTKKPGAGKPSRPGKPGQVIGRPVPPAKKPVRKPGNGVKPYPLPRVR
jgi:hypothetical protein